MQRFRIGLLVVTLVASLGCRPSTKVIIDPDAALEELTPSELVKNLAYDQHRDNVTRILVQRGPEAVPALLPALKHEDWQVRAAAAFALGQMKDQAQTATAELKSLAESDPEPAVRDAAAFALDAIQGN